MSTLSRRLLWSGLLLILLSCACSCQREKAHVQTARHFTNALYNFKFTDAEQYCTDETIPILRLINAMSGLMEQRDDQYPIAIDLISDSLTSDSTAWVQLKVSNGELIHNSQDSIIGAKDTEERVNLVLRNKTWKVHLGL